MNLQILQTLMVCLTVRNLSETSEGYETKPGEPIENETTVVISAGTLQSNNRRLIGCLKSFTRSAEFNRSRLSDLLEKPKSKSF